MSRKQITFDLDTNVLKAVYPTNDYTNAYRDIRRFLKSKGFVHRQGSTYVSKKDMSTREVTIIVKDLSKRYSWLSVCVKEIDVTLLGKTFSLKESVTSNASLDINNNKNSEKTKKEIFENSLNKATNKAKTSVTVNQKPIDLNIEK